MVSFSTGCELVLTDKTSLGSHSFLPIWGPEFRFISFRIGCKYLGLKGEGRREEGRRRGFFYVRVKDNAKKKIYPNCQRDRTCLNEWMVFGKESSGSNQWSKDS